MFVLVRGQYGPLPLVVGGVPLPATARLVTQNRRAMLEPLDYYDLVPSRSGGGGSGAVLSTTLSVVSGNANFMVRTPPSLRVMGTREHLPPA